jgi:hypothetical protein
MDILEIICGVVIGNGITLFALVYALESIHAEKERKEYTPITSTQEPYIATSSLLQWWRANYPKRG